MSKVDHSVPEGIHTIALGIGDMNGILRGKRIPSSHWDAICKSGCAMAGSTFTMDMMCDMWSTPFASFDNGCPDIHVFPETAPQPLPWEPGVAIAFGRCEMHDHTPVPVDPRNALVAQVERAQDMGFEVQVGTELEFYLLDPETLLPKDSGIGVYGLERAAELEHVVGPIRRMINEIGIPIEQSNPEYAPGQIEVNIRYDEALLAADRVVMFRGLVKQLAHAHGYRASFMAKPFYDQSGNGFHTHYSLWKNGENVFSDGGMMNQTGKHFVGGLRKRMAEMSICAAPTPNGLRRRQDQSFCPINNAWGMDNRTLGLRVLEGSPSAVRVEKRDGGADANPYYLLAAEIAAGLDGIEQGIDPGPVCLGNAYELEDAKPLPRDMTTAINLAKQSEWLKSVMGELGHAVYVQQAEREVDYINAQVTQVELDRYLKTF